MNTQPTVYIVDDDPGMCASLRMVMEAAELKAQTYGSGEDFLDDWKANRLGCVVLDLRMRGIGGIEVMQRLRAQNDEMPVIIISGHVDVVTAVRGVKLGAIDILQKPFRTSELVAHVRHMLELSIEQHGRREELIDIRERMNRLTAREADLLRLVVAGLSNKQIAVEMGISIKTVANHRANLMEKTHALNAADLARMSVIAGILPDHV